jgi:hypothetical protein
VNTNLIINPDQVMPEGGKKVIEAKINGGRLEVESDDGRPNTFTLILSSEERES